MTGYELKAHGCVTQDFARITQENFMGQRTIGIDLAIRGDHVARIFDDGRPHAKPIHFRLTSESLSSLVARLRERLPADSTITAVMEPTGMSWFPVARWLERAGIKAIRVKGQRVRALRRYLGSTPKPMLLTPMCSVPSPGSVGCQLTRSMCPTPIAMRCNV